MRSNFRGSRSRSSVYTATFIQGRDCDLDRDPVVLLRVNGVLVCNAKRKCRMARGKVFHLVCNAQRKCRMARGKVLQETKYTRNLVGNH